MYQSVKLCDTCYENLKDMNQNQDQLILSPGQSDYLNQISRKHKSESGMPGSRGRSIELKQELQLLENKE